MDTEGSYHHIDSLSHGHALLSQEPAVGGTLQCQVFAQHRHTWDAQEKITSNIKIRIALESLEHFRQY